MIYLTAGDKIALRIGTSKSHKYCQRCYLALKENQEQFCDDCNVTVNYWLRHRKIAYKLFSFEHGIQWFERNHEGRDRVITKSIAAYYT